MQKALLFLILFSTILMLFAGFFFFYEAQYFSSRASMNQTSFSVENSYVFLTPLKAKADGKQRIRVSVFILNSQGLGVIGKKVILGLDPSIKLDAVQETTDSLGKAIFDLSTTNAGEYYLEVSVDETKLTQKTHLAFY